MSLSDAQRRVHAWISQYEEGYFHPLTNLARLSEEVGELAREVNHRFGQKTKKREEPEGDLAMEMAGPLQPIGMQEDEQDVGSSTSCTK